jgi:alanyl-tRNA synthetase
MTGIATINALNAARGHLSVLSGILKAGAPEELPEKLEHNLAVMRELRVKLDLLVKKEAHNEATRILTGTREIGGLKVVATILEDAEIDVEKLKQIEDLLRDWESSVVAVLAAVRDDKITIMAACGKEAVAKGVRAGDLVREVCKICGGSGGGKPEFAMGGGRDPKKLLSALSYVDEFVRKVLEG